MSHSAQAGTSFDYSAVGQTVIDIEQKTIAALSSRLGQNFNTACELILASKGHIVVTGMGKSGHIGHKISATFASTGTPAFFVHPGEANHGDLGMVTANDLVIAISNSGSNEEILNMIPRLKRLGTPIISLTGNPHSALAKNAEVNLDISVEEEACPLGLAPTSSTTATLVIGDALAIALLKARGFTEEDFALSHPGGALGRRLLITVSDIMHSGATIPCVLESATLSETLLEISAKGLGMTAIVDNNQIVQGIYTDGDLRRSLNKGIDIHQTAIVDIMTKHCTTVTADMMAAEALKIMEGRKINALLVCDHNNKLVGAFNMLDLLNAKVV